MDLTVGERLEISFEGNTYISQVQDVYDDGRYIISVPISRGYTVFIPLGERLKVRFFRPNGIYEFEAVLDSREKKENVEGLAIRKSGSIIRIQRRAYYRFQTVMDIKYKKNDDEDYRYGIIKDISGGGMRVVVDTALEPDDIIDILLPLGKDELNLKGKVIRSNKLDNGIELGICFINIDKWDREKIIKFIFENQRKRITKG
ncbi:c-di-GMP-binding flagellar brake protein YcgR, contains PilZNR and PilZ domains [Caldanaerobius fijiensis DSM 17918]|uniref:C-di-GMP-binding flagellar brake protein YcgR, contains PilZNR and PilZ domains n=1 Tax=Caldanaerobius fijiensis DSM 17918 TaxID=1121256 RepID=A0A1M4XKU1_9THEO|nr:PilZ domain-containing protein [Caldanaerobius fijiensis]SHE93998.1 c-di-GMP-binding flagellar brake protein YcgR, contains PilZNR and PilZ domains [Caldanaerobius fijiensis DSM 17918]